MRYIHVSLTFGLGTFGAALLGCSSGASAHCVPGESIACSCSGGDPGAQVCQANGDYGSCSCGTAKAGDTGASDTDGGSGAGMLNTGSSSGAAAVTSATTIANAVGSACSVDSDCSVIPAGYCPKAGQCTRPCSTHSDCGCPVGTSTADVHAGKCAVGCVDLGSTTTSSDLSVCLRICQSSAGCAPGVACTPVSSLSYCL